MKPVLQQEFDRLAARLAALEANLAKARAELRNLVSGVSGTMDAEFTALSGTVDARFVDLSGSVDSAWKAGDAAIWGSAQAGTTASLNVVSGTLDAARVFDGLDPLRGTRAFDDFYTELVSPPITTGGGTVTRVGHEVGHPGISRFSVAASASLAAATITDMNSSGLVMFGGGPILYEACARLGAVDNGTNNAARRFGFQSSLTVPTDAAFFSANRSRYGDNEYRFVTSATGSRVEQRTGATLDATSWHRLRIEVSPNGDAVTGSIFCTGTMIAQVMTRTYVPSAANMRCGVYTIKMLGAGNISTDVDYQYIQQLLTGSRI